MTSATRLAKLEASLSPTERVLRWLSEAQRYDDFAAYIRAIHADGLDALPLDRLVREAHVTAEAESRGRSREERDRAIRRALGQTIFRFRLVLRAIVLAEAFLQREGLIEIGLTEHLALVATEDGPAHRSVFPTHAEGLTTLRGVALARLDELRALETVELGEPDDDRGDLEGPLALLRPAAEGDGKEDRLPSR